MYRYRIILFAMALLLIAGCSKNVEPSGKEVECTFKADIDFRIIGGDDTSKSGVDTNVGVGTRAGDGSQVNLCVMEIFYNGQLCSRTVAPVNDGKVEIKATVVTERVYDILFWAYSDGYYSAASLRAIKPGDGISRLDSDNMDAFCARCIGIIIDQEQTVIPVTLKRALAMVSPTVTPEGSAKPSISVNAPTNFDLMTNSISDIRVFSWDNSDEFFLFAPEERIDMEMTINGSACPGIPVRRNYKTNIHILNN